MMSSGGLYLSDATSRNSGMSGNALLRKIQRACRTSLEEPDLQLNLDVADYINEKQGAAPRDAVLTIVKLVNSGSTRTAVFALTLLDVLVKNCGYPIHLQISRKEFLNELVKRFPEMPPYKYTKVQGLILTAIEEWYQTICKHSNYKEDMKYIKDMHSLLKYKGYGFPKINQSDLAVLRPSDHLKTPSEIQKEQEIAQAAKLEELIRRGKPEDLREANKLMKVMAGFKEDNAVNAKQALVTEISKLKRKADLFSEMLNAAGDHGAEHDAIVELYSSLKSSQSKFAAIMEEEKDDPAFVQDLLQFNETVTQLIQKYQLLKIGNFDEASKINTSKSLLGGTGATTLANELNLIDFDDDNEDTAAQTGSTGISDDLLDGLNDLNFNSSSKSFGLGGSIMLGSSTPAAPVATTTNHDTLDLLSELSSPRVSKINSASLTPNQDLDFLDALQADSNGSGRLLVHQSSSLKVELEAVRVGPSEIKFTTHFSSLSSQEINNFTFLVAVPKSCKLTLKPQSGNKISPNAVSGIVQEGLIENIPDHKQLKLKWKLTCTNGNQPIEEAAVFTLPKI